MNWAHSFAVTSVGLSLCLTLISCAGPTTPFGPLDSIDPPKPESGPLASQITEAQKQPAHIEFSPKRQVLHASSTWSVRVTDPYGIPPTASLKVLFNNFDVTKDFLKRSRKEISRDLTQMEFYYRDLSLRSSVTNKIVVIYKRNQNSLSQVAEYEVPECSLFEPSSIQSTRPFRPSKKVLQTIEAKARQQNVNPALMAGLIAQESGFNPRAVSWAKAIGLTQVTPLADQEISTYHANWPRSPQVERLPALLLKTWVLTDRIKREDDWRLQPQLSIQGGISYVKYLLEYWNRPSNQKLLSSTVGDQPTELTKVVLASYNSGPSRVNRALRKRSASYLSSRQLTEARKYVAHISSYCYHFARRGGAK